jgi:hypothetical protein
MVAEKAEAGRLEKERRERLWRERERQREEQRRERERLAEQERQRIDFSPQKNERKRQIRREKFHG